MGINLFDSKYKGSIGTLYLLLIYQASLLALFIRFACTLLGWTGSMKLISFTHFLNAIFIVHKYSD